MLPPTDINLTNTTMAENQELGYTIGLLSTTDPNTGDMFTYDLVDTVTYPDNAAFTIDGDQLKTAASFDYEAQSSYTIRVRTTDSGSLSYDKTFAITVVDLLETLVVGAGDWTAAGLTLVVGSDGKMHVYETGTTIDAMPPHNPAKVLGVNIVGRNTDDVLLNDCAVEYGSLLIDHATLTIGQDNVIATGTNVTIDGGILDLNGKIDAISDLVLKSGSILNGTLNATSYRIESGTIRANLIGAGTLAKMTSAQASATTINSATVIVNSGGLTATSITADTLCIGSLPLPISFSDAIPFSTDGINPECVIVGDFNSDGISDLAMANIFNGKVGILLGNGRGGFDPSTPVDSGGSFPMSLTVSDFNRDGKSDLAVANANSNNVRVLFGDGNGGFPSGVTLDAGGYLPYSVSMGDFNCDGKSDLVVANHNSDSVSVLLGDGSGGFATAIPFFTGGIGPYSVAVGDFNHDGKSDLAVVNNRSDTVGVLLGNGNGGFATAIPYSTGSGGPTSVTVGDFNYDGNSDLAVVKYFGNNVGVLLGNGNGGFAAVSQLLSGGVHPYSVSVGDFNGDGKDDLAVANYDSNNVVVLVNGGGIGFGEAHTFSTGGNGARSVVVSDFDSDGKSDLAVTNYDSHTVGVLTNTTLQLGNAAAIPGLSYPVISHIVYLNTATDHAPVITNEAPSISNDSPASASTDNSAITSTAIDFKAMVEPPITNNVNTTTALANSTTSVTLAAVVPQIAHRFIRVVDRVTVIPDAVSAAALPAEIGQHNNKDLLSQTSLDSLFGWVFIADLSIASKFDNQSAYALTSQSALTNRLHDSVYDDLTDSLAQAKKNSSMVLQGSQNVRDLALKSMVTEFQHNLVIEEEDPEVLIDKLSSKQDKLAQEALDEFYADLVGAMD